MNSMKKIMLCAVIISTASTESATRDTVTKTTRTIKRIQRDRPAPRTKKIAQEHTQQYALTPEIQYAQALIKENKIDEALGHIHQYMITNTQDPHAYQLLGLIYFVQGNFEVAQEHLRKSFSLDATNTQTLFLLARCCEVEEKLDDALFFYQQLLNINPFHPRAQQLYTWVTLRASTKQLATYITQEKSLVGKTIVLQAGWGQGDTLQFMRHIIPLKKLGAHIICRPQRSLLHLLKEFEYIDELIDSQTQELPQGDFMTSLILLPQLIKEAGLSMEVEFPYLKPNAERVDYWQGALAHDHNFKIGICWEGNHSHTLERFIPLTTLADLTKLEGVSVYSLQRVNGLEQFNHLKKNHPIIIFDHNFDAEYGAFVDTAAVMKQLDLVVTIDTSIAHLAGALGVPFCVLLASTLWMPGDYPTRTYFQQLSPGDWNSVMSRLIPHIQNLVSIKMMDAKA